MTLVNEFASTLSLRRNALPMLRDVVQLRLREHAGHGTPEPHFVFAAADDATEEPARRIAA